MLFKTIFVCASKYAITTTIAATAAAAATSAASAVPATEHHTLHTQRDEHATKTGEAFTRGSSHLGVAQLTERIR